MKYNYKFWAVDINSDSLKNCARIVKSNSLEDKVFLVHNRNEKTIFKEIFNTNLNNICSLNLIEEENLIYNNINEDTIINFTICNPPYFESFKPYNNKKFCSYNNKEVVCEGGEYEFVKKMIDESFLIKNKVIWFTSLLGCKRNFIEIKNYIKKLSESPEDNCDITALHSEIVVGKQARWIIAWTFFDNSLIKIDKLSIISFRKKNKDSEIKFSTAENKEGKIKLTNRLIETNKKEKANLNKKYLFLEI